MHRMPWSAKADVAFCVIELPRVIIDDSTNKLKITKLSFTPAHREEMREAFLERPQEGYCSESYDDNADDDNSA